MTTTRDLGLDAARGVALLSMFVAHFSPSAGPLGVLNLSEHLTAFLFVLLIGCGAELGRSSPGRWRSSQVRATALVVVGLLLMQLPSGIVVVLVQLGLMTVVAGWLSQLSSGAVAGVGLVALALEPELLDRSREWLVSSARDPISTAAADLLFAGESYRLLAFVLPVCAGILLVRHATSDRARLVAAGASLPVAAVLFGLDQAGTIKVEAYTGTHAELVFNTAMAVIVTALTWVATPRLGYAGSLLASAGTLALTVYTLQVVGDWAYLHDGGRDDNQWSILVGSCVATLLLAAAWMPVRRATGWRGPLEAPVDRLARRGSGDRRVVSSGDRV